MKTLPTDFVRNVDRMGMHIFRQVLRKGNAAIYQRSRSDGSLVGFEVFRVQVKLPAPNWSTVEAREVYPRTKAFGRTAWFCTTMKRAMSRFETILNSEKERGS